MKYPKSRIELNYMILQGINTAEEAICEFMLLQLYKNQHWDQ